VNKLIADVTYKVHKHGQTELEEWLTAEKVAVSSGGHCASSLYAYIYLDIWHSMQQPDFYIVIFFANKWKLSANLGKVLSRPPFHPPPPKKTREKLYILHCAKFTFGRN